MSSETPALSAALAKLAARCDLTAAEAEAAFVEVMEGKLLATYERGGGAPLELLALGDGKFRAKGSATTRLEFQEEDGDVSAFVLETPQGKQTVERVKNMEENQ